MHELGIVYQVVKTVDEVMKEQGLTELESITLEIGEMRDIVPKFIEEAWQAVRQTTPYPDAEMVLEIIPARAKCKHCSAVHNIKDIDFECPQCHSPELEIFSGREFDIKQIVAK